MVKVISKLRTVPSGDDRVRGGKFSLQLRRDGPAVIPLPAKNTTQSLLLCECKKGGK